MANEKRLIDANALSRRLFPIAMNLAKEYGSLGGAVSGVIGHIYDEPTVDAVEVVRCRDCKHWLKDVAGCSDFVGRCEFASYMVGATGYCSYGERKDGNGNG